jgi:hypothetical protein
MSERVSLDPTLLDSSEMTFPSAEGEETDSDRSSSVSLIGAPVEANDPLSEVLLGTTALIDMSNFSIDSYANQLMDEVFEDLERSLEPGASLPTEPVKPPEPTSQPSSLPGLILSSLMSRSGSTIIDSALTDSELTDSELPNSEMEADAAGIEPLVAPSSELTQNQAKMIPRQRGGLGRSFDQLLFAVACASLVATAALWIIFRNAGEQAVPVASDPATGQMQVAPEDQSFLNYIERSLDNIARRTEANRQIAASSTPSTNNPGSVSVAGNPPAPGASPTVLERVYIPVYQPPQAIATAPNTLPNPVTVAPVPGTAAPQPSVAAAPTPIPNIAPSATHLLVGLLEQGDRSVALFEINGAVQRIQIGESIGASGWALVSVSNSEAIVRRNGEVRSIFVGQRF